MSKWNESYKPSLNTGCFGSYNYIPLCDMNPKMYGEYIPNNEQGYVMNKLDKTLEHIKFDINNYYPYIKDYTFDTQFIDISPKYCYSIIKYYKTRYCGKTLRMSLNDVENIKSLNRILDGEIKKCMRKWYGNDDSKGNGVFIRFSNRSPKDGHKK